jgi:hypothetical protein
MTRVGHALLTLVGGACLITGCSGSTPRDINFNMDGSGFEPPPFTGDTSEDGGATGVAGAGGTAGTGAGGASGAGGAAVDADADAVSDGGAG